jgi:hypothetical protein
MATNDPYDRDRDALGEPVQGTRPADSPVESVGRRAAPAAPKVAVRHGGSPLRWIIPLLLLLVIGFALTRNRRAEPEVATVDPTSTQTASGGEVAAPAAPTVADPKAIPSFVTWANKGGNAAVPAEAEGDHPYTAEGLGLLADALTAASVGKGNYMTRIADIRSQAEQLKASSGQDRHSEYAHKAFVDASNLIAELRGAHEGNAALSAAAEKVQPSKPLGPQGTEVRAFFREAAKALNGMKPAADSTATK